MLFEYIRDRLMRLARSRKPDFTVGDRYLERWWIIPRNRWFNIYLHRFGRSDDDRALHDHPWLNVSILLVGRYVEHTIPAGGVHMRKTYRAGDVKFRRPRAAHRVEPYPGDGPVWSLFITGPVVRNWGFHCEHGWRRWQDFVDPNDPGQRGPGCD